VKDEGWVHRLLRPARAQHCWWFNNRVETAYAQFLAMRAALGSEVFDVVEAPECGGDAAAVSTLLPVRVAIRFHSPARLIMSTYQTTKLDRRLTAFVEQIAIRRAHIRTACSQFLADQTTALMGVPPPVHVVPNGIDLELFDRDEEGDARDRFGLPRDGVVVLFANRLEERKGIHLIHDIALRVMKRHGHVHFVLAGRDLFGYVAENVLPKIEAEGLATRFHVLGSLDLSSVRALLKVSDIFLLPSLWENCPYSCIEAMAARRAIVSSDCGGMPELIADRGNGLLAQNGDAASFADRLEELVEDTALRERLGAAARATVEHRLTDMAVARRIAELYRGALSAQ
jgi:glycosyltransferase involved in cell wall biosynthesis